EIGVRRRWHIEQRKVACNRGITLQASYIVLQILTFFLLDQYLANLLTNSIERLVAKLGFVGFVVRLNLGLGYGDTATVKLCVERVEIDAFGDMLHGVGKVLILVRLALACPSANQYIRHHF